jgi:hypothetical protein
MGWYLPPLKASDLGERVSTGLLFVNEMLVALLPPALYAVPRIHDSKEGIYRHFLKIERIPHSNLLSISNY